MVLVEKKWLANKSWQNIDSGLALHTLCLHPGADQSQRVTGYLATRAGYGTTGEQHQNAWVGRVFGVARQPEVLQALVRTGEYLCERNPNMEVELCIEIFTLWFHYRHAPRTLPDLCQHRGWCPEYWGRSPCKTPLFPHSLGFSWHSQTFLSTVQSSSVSDGFSAPARMQQFGKIGNQLLVPKLPSVWTTFFNI